MENALVSVHQIVAYADQVCNPFVTHVVHVQKEREP